MGTDIPTETLCDRYERLYTGAVTDVLDTEYGRYDQTMDTALSPLADDMTTAGVAYPVIGRQNRAIDPEENIRSILQMLGEAPEHGVLTYQTNDDRAAHLGELSVTALAEQGCRGAVVDGCVRDVAYMLDHGFPVFTKHRTPADAVPRWEILDWDTAAVVGGVRVEPGDVVVADADGVVVVPEEIAEGVLVEAETLVDSESAVRDAVADGVSPLQAYEDHGTF